MLLKFERPADQSVSVQNKRASYGQTYYNKYALKAIVDTSNVLTETELRKQVANWLVQYLDIKEGSTQHKAILAVYNDSKLCPRYTMTTSDPWCATAVSAAFIACGLAGAAGTGVTPSTTPDTSSESKTNATFPAVPFMVKVLISDLNYRSEGSMNGKVLGQTGKGSFTITEVNSGGWGKLKSGAGWIYLENPAYCTIGKHVETSSSASTFTAYKVRVTADVLNIRKGAGTNYGKNGAIKDKGVYTIVAEANGKGATKWGKLKSGAGWISLDYCKKV